MIANPYYSVGGAGVGGQTCHTRNGKGKMYTGFSKLWLPDRVGSGTGTKGAIIGRSSYFPVVAWGTSTAVITNCVISADLRHKIQMVLNNNKQQE